jgi:hypothetical protein
MLVAPDLGCFDTYGHKFGPQAKDEYSTLLSAIPRVHGWCGYLNSQVSFISFWKHIAVLFAEDLEADFDC